MINKYTTGVVNDIKNFVAENQKPRGWQFLDDCINDKEKTINILDVGFGSGNIVLHLWQSGYKNIQGIEYTKELYEQMQLTHPYLKIQTGNAENLLPLKDGVFDCVYCNQVLEHLPHPELAIKESYRVLRDGGVYIISVPNGHHLNDVITKIIQKIIYGRYEHLQSFSYKSIRCMLENQGFVVNKSASRKHSLDFLLDDRIPKPFRVIATKIIYPICKKVYWKDMFFDILATKQTKISDYNNICTHLQTRFNAGGRFQRCQVDKFLSLLNKNYKKSLEVGCGKGFFSYVATKTGRVTEVAGCDVFDDFQIKELSQYTNKVEYKNIENNTVPYEDNTFDLVFSMDVLEHVEDDAVFVKEHLRVCKKGGRVIIGTPNYFRVTNLPLYLLGKLKYPRDMGSDTYGKCIHLREYKKEQLLALVRGSVAFIDKDSVMITPCWLGVMALDVGTGKLPSFLENYCQFWFLTFNKKL